MDAVTMTDDRWRNLGLELVRASEAAALAAGRWMGLGRPEEADEDAATAMHAALNSVSMAGLIVIGKESRLGLHSPLDAGQRVGTGQGPAVDVVLDPIEGRSLLAQGLPDAISVVGVAPRGAMWAPTPALYMDKIVVDRDVAPYLVEECLHAPAAWTLALVARAKGRAVRDLVVFVLDRPRHRDLIHEIHSAGARTQVRTDGDVAGALMAASAQTNVDVLMGIGGVPEGVMSACAVKCVGGGMLGRLAPQTSPERSAVEAAGLEAQRVLSCDELVSADRVFFAATGITDGSLLSGVRYRGSEAQTESLVLRAETHTRRRIRTEYALGGE